MFPGGKFKLMDLGILSVGHAEPVRAFMEDQAVRNIHSSFHQHKIRNMFPFRRELGHPGIAVTIADIH